MGFQWPKGDGKHHTVGRRAFENWHVRRVVVGQSKRSTRDTSTFQTYEHTSGRRVEAHARRAKLTGSLGAVKDANLPTSALQLDPKNQNAIDRLKKLKETK